MYAIINRSSGSIPGGAAEELNRLLRKLGREDARIDLVDPSDLPHAFRDLECEEGDQIIIWGGDGTVACGLNHLCERRPTVLALPGGTMNVLHRAVHGEFTHWSDVLERALSEGGRARDLRAGVVGQKRFYAGLFLGNLSDLAKPREQLRKGDLLGAARELTGHGIFELESHLEVTVSREGAEDVVLKGVAVGIFFADHDAPLFDVGVIDPHSPLELLELATEAMFADWRKAPDVAYHQGDVLKVRHLTGLPIRATFDGEPVDLPPQAEIRLDPKAARVLSARND
jgi:diacylglycerol kinase family enzyme